MKFYQRKIIRLSDGRKLSYQDIGPQNGIPVFYFHGVPSSCSEWQMWGNEAMLKGLGIRLVAVDRPGVGASTFQLNRTISKWPSDVTALADGLGIKKFAVMGYSGGGPYAAVCAAKIKDRLISTALVSSLAPFDLPDMLKGVDAGNVKFLKLSFQKPWLFRVIYWQLGILSKYAPKQYLKRALLTFDSADRAAFGRSEVYAPIFTARGSARGQQVDTELIIGDWDFKIAEINMPVQIWYGEQDHNASLSMYRYLAVGISKADAHLIPGEGHISLIVNNAENILKYLIENH
jgi:pimeloyl-ACP methyl ester carboxylesterase